MGSSRHLSAIISPPTYQSQAGVSAVSPTVSLRAVTGTLGTLLTPDTESEDDVKEDNEEGETICDDSLLAELSTINSSFSLSLDSNQIQPHQGDNSPPPQSFVFQL